MFSRHRRSLRLLSRSGLTACMLASGLICGLPAHAQSARESCEQGFRPSTGQPGKDVVWVPTSDALVKRMLEMAQVKSSDLVYDLGAGDGKIAIAAAKQFGAQAVGVEYNPDMARLADCFARAEGVADKVKIIQGDIFETDFSHATVVTLYLLPELNLRLRPTLLRMKPGTRVVSHSFLMEDWQSDASSVSNDGAAYLWIVPAQAGGRWVFEQPGGKERFAVDLKQTFQKLSGTAGNAEPIQGEVKGSQVSFHFPAVAVAAATQVDGQIAGDRIEAQVKRNGKAANFIGKRQP